jgi:Uma2 family endonuclease
MAIRQLSQLDLNATYSYADYLTWQLDETVELIKGKIMAMSPAPTSEHQSISRNLSLTIGNYLRKKPCSLFYAPFDVRLYDRKKSIVANRDIYSVVQPDLCVICDTHKIDIHGCLGAPNWVIEILSRGNAKKDATVKYTLYEESGITEYWLVYPYEKAVHQFVLDETTGKYQFIGVYGDDASVSPHLFPDCHIDLNEVFEKDPK